MSQKEDGPWATLNISTAMTQSRRMRLVIIRAHGHCATLRDSEAAGYYRFLVAGRPVILREAIYSDLLRHVLLFVIANRGRWASLAARYCRSDSCSTSM